MPQIEFGWTAPVIGVPESGGQPIVMQELDRVLPAVAQHFDSVWTADHFYGFDRIDDPYLECWTTLTWLAATFPSLKVGGLVMCNNYRHPAVLAHMGKTLQAFSGGRLILGIGAGWREDEYRRHGMPFDLPCEPKPNPIPPIMVGGGGEKLLLRLVAQHADWWDFGGSPEAYAHKIEVLQKHCQAVGRDLNSIVKNVSLELPLPADAPAARQTAERLQKYVDLGVTQFKLDCGVVTNADLVRRIGEDVLARFR
jgi:alkanesulfonate monooxygenase SsuD/methylene tetrahydromethanopterin reductase-like flavin-dependent oxidoreductase (luciferase family)